MDDLSVFSLPTEGKTSNSKSFRAVISSEFLGSTAEDDTATICNQVKAKP